MKQIRGSRKNRKGNDVWVRDFIYSRETKAWSGGWATAVTQKRWQFVGKGVIAA